MSHNELVSDPLDFTYLQDYKKAIAQGKYRIGKWMKLNFEMIEKLLISKEAFFDPVKAAKAIGFIEKHVKFVEGKSGPFLLEIWQKYLVSCIYGIVDKEGVRRFSEVVLIVGRKQGKSALVSALELTTVFTQKEIGMQIYNLAPKLQQADIIYGQCLLMIEKNPVLARKGKKRRNDYYLKDKNCKMAPLAFSSKKSDGFNPYFVAYDEFAAWEGHKGKMMYDVMMSGQGSRLDPINIACSTANYVDNGLYDELFTRSTAALLGTSEETSLLPFLYMIDDEEKWDDIEELKKALPNLGVSFYERNLQKEIKKAHQSPSYRAEFLTKYCNLKQNLACAWLSDADIKMSQCQKLRPEFFAGCYGVGGVDLSQTTDLTSACIVIPIEDTFYVLSHFWMPAAKLKDLTERDNIDYTTFISLGFLSLSGDKFVDYKDVTKWFDDMRKNYQIDCPVVGYDRYSSTYFVDDMQNVGYKMDDVIQGTNLTPIMDQFYGLIQEGKIKTGTNGLLQMHMRNAAVQKVTNDNRVRMTKIDPEKHIDGLAALIDALTVRSKWSRDYEWVWNANKLTEEGSNGLAE